jgi:hypothetical protein
MSIGFCFGISLGIKDRTMRTLARGLSFVPPLVAYLSLKPPSFGSSVSVMLSTSQWIALISALLVSYFYAQYWAAAQRSPALAMSLGIASSVLPSREIEENDEDERSSDPPEVDISKTVPEAPVSKRKKRKGKKGREAGVAPEAVPDGEDEEKPPLAAKPKSEAEEAIEEAKP